MRSSLLILTLLPAFSFGQIDSTRFKLIEDLTKNIRRIYLDTNIAKAMCDTVNYKLRAGKYDSSLNLDEFTYEVNKDLRQVSNDHHIAVSPAHFTASSYNDEIEYKENRSQQWAPKDKEEIEKWQAFLKKLEERKKLDMFTYGEIKILPGNIGYVEIKDFNSTTYSKKRNRNRISFESVLKFLAKTNAIIIDFRENLGGHIFLSARFCSYFSEAPNTYFLTTERVFRYDSSGVKKELNYRDKYYTNKDIRNTVVGNKKIFVLTSKRTFSAGELCTYKLKQLNHNTIIVGEKTTGGGNGHTGATIGRYCYAVIPSIKAFDENNANFNIEAKGITPDIQTTSDSAFSIAYDLSLSGNKGNGKLKTKYFKREKPNHEQKKNFFTKSDDEFVGNYRKVLVTKENGKLFMTYDFYLKQVLIPDAADSFTTNGFQSVRFLRNTENKIVEVHIKQRDGYTEKFRRL